MKTLFFLGIFVIIGLLSVPHTYAQQQQHSFDPTEINGLLDQLARKIDIAELHGNTTAQDMYNSQRTVVVCIFNTFMSIDTTPLAGTAAQACDSDVVGVVVHHELGNNQTILALAHQYLAARGIK